MRGEGEPGNEATKTYHRLATRPSRVRARGCGSARLQQLQNGGYDHEAGLLAHAQSYYRKFRFADCCIHIARRFALYVSVYTTASMGPGMAGSGA